MADDNDLEIKFGADASGVSAGSAEAVESVAGVAEAVQQLGASMAEQTAAIREGFAGMAESSRQTKAEIVKDAEEEEASLAGLILKVHEGVESFNEFKESLAGIAEVYLAAFAVEAVVEFAKKMGEAAEQVEHTAEAFGLSSEEVQELNARFTAAGVSIDKVPSSLTRVDRAASEAVSGGKKAADTFKQLGIDLEQPRTQAELLNDTLAALGKVDDPIRRTAEGLAIFGRSYQQLAPLVADYAAAQAEANRQTAEYDLKNQDAITQGAALGAAFNENKNAMVGLGNVLTESLAPAFVEIVGDVNSVIGAIIKSYTEGGAARQVFDLLGQVLHDLSIVMRTVGEVFVTAFGQVGDQSKSTKKDFDGVREAVAAFAAILVAVITIAGEIVVNIRLLGKELDVLNDRFENAGNAAHNFFMGRGYAANNVLLDKLHADIAAADELAGKLRALDQQGSKAFDALLNPQAPRAAAKPEGKPVRGTPTKLGGSGDKEKKGPDIVAEWEQTLHAQEVASNDFFHDQTANELAFWEGKLALTTSGSKDWLAVQSKIYELRKTLAQRDFAEQQAQLEAQIQAASEDGAKQLALEQTKVDRIAATYGRQSVEYQTALREQERMLEQHNAQIAALELKRVQTSEQNAITASKADTDAAKASITAQQALLGDRVAERQIDAVQATEQRAAMNAQLLALDRTEADREYQLATDSARDQLAIENLKPAARQQVLDQLAKAETAHQARITQIDAQAGAEQVKDAAATARAVYDKWAGITQPIVNSFGQMFTGLIEGTETFRQAWAKLGDTMLQMVVSWGERQAVAWIASQFIQTQATAEGIVQRAGLETAASAQSIATNGASSLELIAQHAAVAAAGAYAAISSIPFVGPVLAPIAAAAALAAVIALGKTIFSARDGIGQVPYDGAMFELHKDETVLPADIATPLRAAVRPGGALAASQSAGAGAALGQAGAEGAAAGDTHYHSWSIQAVDAKSVQRLFRDNGDAIYHSAAQAARRGAGRKVGDSRA